MDLVARALKNEHPVPKTLVEPADRDNSPLDAVSALSQARDFLRWIEKLAQDWETPEENKVLKGKGQLYLGVYVQLVARGRRKVMKDCEEMVELVLPQFSDFFDFFDSFDSSQGPTSIRKKLTNFRYRYPRVYNKLYSKLKKLHLLEAERLRLHSKLQDLHS